MLIFHAVSAVFHIEKITASGGLGVEYIQPYWDVSGKLCLSSCISFFGSMFLTEHITGQCGLMLLVAPCWMEGPNLPTVLKMLEDIPQHCPVIKNLIMEVLVGQVLKDLPYLHLTIWLLKICVAQTRVLFLSLSGGGRGN